MQSRWKLAPLNLTFSAMLPSVSRGPFAPKADAWAEHGLCGSSVEATLAALGSAWALGAPPLRLQLTGEAWAPSIALGFPLSAAYAATHAWTERVTAMVTH